MRNFCSSNGLDETIKKYRDRVWPDTIKYWCSDKHRQNAINKSNRRYNENKSDDIFLGHRAELSRQYRTTERGKEYIKLYQEEHKDRYKENAKSHREANIKNYQLLSQAYYAANEPKLRELGKLWYQNNKKRSHELELLRYHNNPVAKLSSAVRVGLRRALKYAKVGKEHPSIIYLGCTIEEFKAHIEKQWKPGMNWDNHGDWYLNHIKPFSIIEDINDQTLLKELCHYTNYQPLWK